jgi:hypothetical protein
LKNPHFIPAKLSLQVFNYYLSHISCKVISWHINPVANPLDTDLWADATALQFLDQRTTKPHFSEVEAGK